MNDTRSTAMPVFAPVRDRGGSLSTLSWSSSTVEIATFHGSALHNSSPKTLIGVLG